MMMMMMMMFSRLCKYFLRVCFMCENTDDDDDDDDKWKIVVQ